MRIVVECSACGFEREVTRQQIINGGWKRQPCPACHHAPDGLPVECDCGHVSVAPRAAIVAGTVAPCPGCEAGDD